MARKVDAQQLQLDPALLERGPTSRNEAPRGRKSKPHPREGRIAVAATMAHRSMTARHASLRPAAPELLATPGALLTRSDLRGLGLERRAVDAVFRSLPVVTFPGYSRPMIRADQYLELVRRSTYCDDRVRPCHA